MVMIFDPLDFEKRPLLARLNRLRALTAFSLFLENCSNSLWRMLSWILFFSALWLLEIPEIAEKPGLVFCLLLFLSGAGLLLYFDATKLHWPKDTEIDRRLEEQNNLPHRPLSTLKDTLANPGKGDTRILWQQNKELAASALQNLKTPLPRPCLAARDPLALRFFSLLFLLIGLTIAGSQAGTRLMHGLLPLSNTLEGTVSNSVTLWITPPAYTKMPQIILQDGKSTEERLKIPEGSLVKAHVNGGFIKPTLTMGAQALPLEKIADNKNWGIETTITSGKRLVLRQGPLTKIAISYDYLIDQPPQISFNKDDNTTSKNSLRLPVKMFDDYGITNLTLRMNLAPEISPPPFGAIFEETRPVMSAPGESIDLAPVYDLFWHPWAGLPVILTFEAKDAKEQIGATPPLQITLPEKTFTNPTALQLIALRKRLIRTPEEAVSSAPFDLIRLLSDPAQFNNNPSIFLALRSAAGRLSYDSSAESIARVIELLWDVALTLEEGNLPLAARALEEARKNLEQALADPNATDEQIARALEELQQALATYFQEMFRDLQKQMAEKGLQVQIPLELMQNTISASDLESFLDQLRAEALSGDKNAAREKLAQLREFMDMLQSAQDMTMPEPMQFMMEGIGKLQELIEKQKKLRDKTTALAKKNEPAPSAKPLETEQESLRATLGELMLDADEKLGDIPENMGNAEMVMRESARALSENAPESALPHQEEAIRQLEDSAKDMAQQIQQMMQQMTLFSLGTGGRLDPLGRPMPQEGNGSGFFTDSRIKIPDEAQRKNVQAILKTLRQRAGERSRPDYERDYYHRLMKQF